MVPSNKFSARKPILLRRKRSSYHGKITLVTIVAILGMVVLAGFIGNAGHVVTKKVETQNAADAIAFSSAQWMARGMNAATATNHLLGEVTGLVVILEALGGPEVDAKIEAYPKQVEIVDRMNNQIMKTAPIRGLPAYLVTEPVTRADKQFIEKLTKLVSPDPKNKKKLKAFATIYDAKYTLKRDLTKRLVHKSAANVLLFVPPPWGYLTAAGGWAIHIKSEYEMLRIAKEWLILEGMEIAVLKIVEPLKVKVLERQLIPALAAHGDFLAGRPRNASDQKAAKTGFVNGALGDTLRHLGEVYQVKAAVFPKPESFRLPISPEPAPSLRGSGFTELEWGSDAVSSVADATLLGLNNDASSAKGKIKWRIFELSQEIQKLDKLESDVNDQLKDDKLSQDQRRRLEEERKEIAASRKQKQEKIKQLEKELAQLEKEEREMMKTMKQLNDLPSTTGNVSINHIPTGKKNEKDKMNPGEERFTQWVRATYPYVDSYRAPILEIFDEHLRKSEASKHYEKWTNRYTLVKAWQFRSGFRFEKGAKKNGDDTGVWRKKPNVFPLSMYVMAEKYNEQIPSTQPGKTRARVQKGYEEWTKSTTESKREAEKMFTVIGMTHRKLEPLFSPIVYPVASEEGITTFAQAIFYNANEQTPASKKGNSILDLPELRQAKIGWDTLNWHPESNAPEWGAKASKTDGAAKWPWDLFTAQPDPNKVPQIKTAWVKLNWQAKLMPVTHSRLSDAASPGAAPLEMTKSLFKANQLFEGMVSH